MLLDESIHVHKTQDDSTTNTGDFDFTLGDPTPERPLWDTYVGASLCYIE